MINTTMTIKSSYDYVPFITKYCHYVLQPMIAWLITEMYVIKVLMNGLWFIASSLPICCIYNDAYCRDLVRDITGFKDLLVHGFLFCVTWFIWIFPLAGMELGCGVNCLAKAKWHLFEYSHVPMESGDVFGIPSPLDFSGIQNYPVLFQTWKPYIGSPL